MLYILYVYTGSFEFDYRRTLLAALHVHRIEIPYGPLPGAGWSKNSIA